MNNIYANGRIKTLEALRTLAFICVFLHHTGLKYFKFGVGGSISIFNFIRFCSCDKLLFNR